MRYGLHPVLEPQVQDLGTSVAAEPVRASARSAQGFWWRCHASVMLHPLCPWPVTGVRPPCDANGAH